jgi:hypothetical protein
MFMEAGYPSAHGCWIDLKNARNFCWRKALEYPPNSKLATVLKFWL